MFSIVFKTHQPYESTINQLFVFFRCICRPVDTPQSYSKGPQPTQVGSRSAASPLSPPRPGATTNYPPFSGMPAREAPINRYVQQSPYGAVQVSCRIKWPPLIADHICHMLIVALSPGPQPFRENPYARVPQVPQQVEYHRTGPISVPASISISHGPAPPPTSTIETIANNASNRPRISLMPDGLYSPFRIGSNYGRVHGSTRSATHTVGAMPFPFFTASTRPKPNRSHANFTWFFFCSSLSSAQTDASQTNICLTEHNRPTRADLLRSKKFASPKITRNRRRHC